ncbi:MAG TPA: pirin family protein [Rhodocyclaceae bacterium]|nr:pirin family protein [Rhodocyclaceae bacterium]
MDAPVMSPEVARPRAVERLVGGQDVMDGAGVRINRVLAQNLQRRLDPFLMLDIFGSNDPGDYIAGFPDHPHRGFETVTYMIAGRMRHRDNAGHEGLLENGGMQWMTAGRGVIHSEMPEQEEGIMEGFQLWLNLPAKDKMAAPWYRDFQAADLPRYRTAEGIEVAVLAGMSRGMAGAVTRPVTEPLYLDIRLPAGADFAEPLPAGHNAFVVPYRGEVEVGGTAVPRGRMALLANEGDGVAIRASRAASAVLIAGRPLDEPIAQHGPFVMNTQEEILQAFRDYRDGRFG